MCMHTSIPDTLRNGGPSADPSGPPSPSTDPTAPDPQAVEAFGERIGSALNEGGMLLLLALGDRTGLLEALSDGGPVTSRELAETTGLEERYVREWLHGLTVAGVLELEGDDRFRLPPAHAALLTRSGGENMAIYGQFLSMSASVEDEVVHCFREGGGVPYERFHRFHEIMAEDSAQIVLAALHEHILPLAPELPARLEEGIDVADLGCGRGRALRALARRYPASRFVGWDLSEEAIEWARDRAEEEGLTNVRFAVRDLSDFDATASENRFDLITTFDAVHDQAFPERLVAGIARALRPDGVYLMQDIQAHSHVAENVDHPLGTFLYTLSLTHCMTVSLAQGGRGLGTMWGREMARELLAEAGFADVTVHQFEHDVQNDYYVVRHG